MNDPATDTLPPTCYVGIGASAGGLEAIETFFENMPPHNNFVFIVIQHLSPHFKSLMTELLSKRTQMPVHKIEDGMQVQANAIYMIPPSKNVTLFHGKLILKEQDRTQGGVNLPIDVFFQSLAEDQGPKAIAIVLSGTGSDGTRGIRKIKEMGGMVMVQSQESASFDGMPRSAINTGLVDFVLPPQEMPAQLLSFTTHPYAQKAILTDKLITNDNGITRVFALLREHHKIDFTYYKPSTVLRRIERRMTVNQIHDLKEYALFMESYHKEIDALYRELLIGVTNFFRDREAFALVKDQILPEIFSRVDDKEVRLWSAACSTGEEAYTLAILCQETMQNLGRDIDVKIFATDVDRNALTLAGSGVYSESIAADLAPELLSKYFLRKDDNYHVVRKLREMVVFAQHNLIKDPPFTNIDFLSCRNVLIYLQPILQKKALEFFNFALTPQGVLLLGSSESLGECGDLFDPIDTKWKLFRTKGKRKPRGFVGNNLPTYDAINQRNYGVPVTRTVNESDRFLERFLHAFTENPDQLLAIVVTAKGELVYTLCDKEKYLTTPIGRSSFDVHKMIIKELAIPFATSLQKAFKTGNEIRYSNIILKSAQSTQAVQMRIKTLPEKKGQDSYAAVFIEKNNFTPMGLDASNTQLYDVSKETEQRLQDVEQELQFVKENLQATIEELETSNEELQATNEELLASNEELQSTNEELQSVNEELFSVNSEHQQKIMELTILNNDVENLLLSTEIATMFIDENMEVRKFTPKINQLFKIIDSDLGRPLTHLAHYLIDEDPVALAIHVMESQKNLEKEINTSSGKKYLMNVTPYRIAADLHSGVVITFTDISKIKAIQTALEQTRERYHLSQQAANFAVWDWNIQTGDHYWSKSLETLFGLKKGASKEEGFNLAKYIHPEDNERRTELLRQAINTHQPYNIVYRAFCPDENNIRWINSTGKVFCDPDTNKPIRVLGVIKDITEERQALAEKHQAQQDLLLTEIIFEAEIPSFITDAAGTILKVNRALAELTGYSKAELVGKNHIILKSEQHDNEFYQHLYESLIEKGFWEGKICARHKSGDLFFTHLRVVSVKNQNNENLHFVGHFQNLRTEAKSTNI